MILARHQRTTDEPWPSRRSESRERVSRAGSMPAGDARLRRRKVERNRIPHIVHQLGRAIASGKASGQLSDLIRDAPTLVVDIDTQVQPGRSARG
jgi:hypothetical protein